MTARIRLTDLAELRVQPVEPPDGAPVALDVRIFRRPPCETVHVATMAGFRCPLVLVPELVAALNEQLAECER